MARTATLVSLRTQAKQRADMEAYGFITDVEWNGLISQSAAELYDILTTAYEDYFATALPFTTTAGVSSYALPADFYKLLGLDQATGGNLNVSCEPYEFAERNHYANYNAGNQVFTVQYIPCCPPLVIDSDTFDGVNGWEEYIVVDAAIKARTKEESDVSELERAKAMLLKRIEDSAPSRDAGMGGRVTDVHHMDPYMGLISPGPARYRLMGNNIVLKSRLAPLGYS